MGTGSHIVRTALAVPVHDDAHAAELLEIILTATNDGVVEWYIDSNQVVYSARWKAILGYDAESLVDTPDLWRQMTHPEDLSTLDAAVREQIDGCWPLDRMVRMRHQNGAWRCLHMRGHSVKDKLGTTTRLVWLFNDVTERVETEATHRFLATALQLAGDGIYGLSPRAEIVFMNGAALQMLGWTTDDLGGLRGHDVCHPGSERCDHTCPIYQALVEGKTGRVTSHFGRKDGMLIPVEYVATAILDGKRIAGAVITFRDLSQQRLLESQLLQAQKLEAIGQLAAGVAHEINTPMQYLGDNVHFLKQGFSDLMALVETYDVALYAPSTSLPAAVTRQLEQARSDADFEYLKAAIPAALDGCASGVTAVSSIVRAMKAFSHPGGVDKEPEDLNDALSNTLAVSRNEWKYVADVTTDLAADLPMVHCLRGEISQVFLNLIINASHAIGDVVKAGRYEKGLITISTSSTGSNVEVRITDNGAGIPEAVRHRLFEHFFTTKEVGRGTGQGLSLARNIVVNKHGGAIEFETEVGVGTTFTVKLPVT